MNINLHFLFTSSEKARLCPSMFLKKAYHAAGSLKPKVSSDINESVKTNRFMLKLVVLISSFRLCLNIVF